MKRLNRLPANLLAITSILLVGLFVSATTAFAAHLKYDPSSGTISEPTQIQVLVDTEGEAVDSAVAVVTYDPNRVEISSVTEGDFFDSIAIDSSTAGEVAITGTLNIGDIDGVTGTGVLATLAVSPQITEGSFTLGFRCSAADIDDSNIMSVEGTNLLATDEQCAQNVSGSYDVDGEETETEEVTTQETTEGDQPVLPEELPESGFGNLLKIITSGLALIGIGLLLL